MKRLSDLFRSKSSGSEPDAPLDEAVLADLEAKSEVAELGFRWVPLNRAGDLCYRAGESGRALGYYGRAIDAMLEDGQPEPARGLATKIVRIHPSAVRTLCTLTWLDLASHHMASVVVHLNEYVTSAKAGGRQELATDQIFSMARLVTDTEFRCAAIDALDELEAESQAAAVKEWVVAGQAPHDAEDSEDWADICLSHALGSNVGKIDGEGNEEESEEGAEEESAAGPADAPENEFEEGPGDESEAEEQDESEEEPEDESEAEEEDGSEEEPEDESEEEPEAGSAAVEENRA